MNVDWITKSTLFLLVKDNLLSRIPCQIIYSSGSQTSWDVCVYVILDRGAQFTVQYSKSFQNLGSKMNLSTAFHPQSDYHVERTNQTLEDMLSTCVIHFKGNWDNHLPFIEYLYNNSYHSSIQIYSCDALFKRRCKYSIGWF